MSCPDNPPLTPAHHILSSLSLKLRCKLILAALIYCFRIKILQAIFSCLLPCTFPTAICVSPACPAFETNWAKLHISTYASVHFLLLNYNGNFSIPYSANHDRRKVAGFWESCTFVLEVNLCCIAVLSLSLKAKGLHYVIVGNWTQIFSITKPGPWRQALVVQTAKSGVRWTSLPMLHTLDSFVPLFPLLKKILYVFEALQNIV